ncbi:MAG: class I SAM-dependent methyltransferase, partial [Pseudomonadota bacterium]
MTRTTSASTWSIWSTAKTFDTRRAALSKPDQPHSLQIDFVGGRMAHRRRFGGGRGQTLARAVGLRGPGPLHVVDATAGVGTDAFVLASLGCDVTLIERLPEAAEALRSALAEATEHAETADIIARMALIEGDAIDLLQHWRQPLPDVVYLDPMYPRTKHKSANAKSMHRLQQLAGPDTDSEQLLAAALGVATKRVVVKRP